MSERPAVTLTDGSPVPEDGSHKRLKANGQQEGYVVLSEEERAKGFVRPVRRSYVHVGPPGPAYPLRDLTDDEKVRHGDSGYVKFEPYPKGAHGSALGRYWTQAQIDKIGKGCGGLTTMGQTLAETYAREPGFYGGTFCVDCRAHFPVGAKGEFVWDGTQQRVGT